jgi:NADPH-dependent glutamate synthase beta subunit-like oxidoreductase
MTGEKKSVIAMTSITLTINDNEIVTDKGKSILDAARDAEIYIPSLCAHPDLPAMKDYETVEAVFHGDVCYNNDGKQNEEGCRLCLVDNDGEIVRACATNVKAGMVIKTDTPEVQNLRNLNLSKILSTHPHACLTCAQQEGCTREPCSTNVPVEERCCPKLGNCELQKVSSYIGIPEDTPRYVPANLPMVDNEPLFIRDYNLCIGCTRCVRACNDLRGVKALGMVYQNGKAILGPIAPSLKESECKFCGACIEVCPTGALMDKTTSSAYDRASGLAPCTSSCPAHIDIPRYTRLIAEGKADDALAVIREKVPFPRVLGRICMHPCEENCRRSELNESIAICALKRYASEMDKGRWKQEKKKIKPTGKKVAVIGSGPAGMTTAFYTAKAGHSVTIFEGAPTPGGMLANTIPLYRLPKDVLDEDLQDILEAGEIELRTNQALGRDFSMPDLISSGYNSIFLSLGLQLSRKIDIKGIDSKNVIWGTDFLKQVRDGERTETGKNVIVIGGGNVAVDVARTSRRLGAEKVRLVCLETRDEMPAHEWEIAAAEEEDIEVNCSWGPMQIISDDDDVKGVKLKSCTSVFDPKGKFCPEYDETETIDMEADSIILAIGQTADITSIDDSTMELLDDSNMIKIDPDNLRTSMKGVWAGGDIVKMPGTVIDAIQMGRTAAGQINKYLGGSDDISEVLVDYEKPTQLLGRDYGFYDKKRSNIKTIEKDQRTSSFDEVEVTYDDDTAQQEAKRCLQCDLRLIIGENPMPPEPWLIVSDDNIQTVPEEEGVIQLLDDKKEVILIKGAMNMREELENQVKGNENIKYFIFEADKMYTQRESELLSQYMQKHGKMPGSADDDDDLF